MANKYKALSARAKAIHGEAPFEADLSVLDERHELDGGHLEIVPRPYRVLSDNFSAGKQDEVVQLALPVETEAALIQGGHIERADKPASTNKKG